MSDTRTIYQFNDNLVEWDSMIRSSDEAFVSTATVVMTLIDPNGVNVTGVVSLPMSYVTSSNGTYQGTIPYNIDWATVAPVGSGYTLRVVATGSINARRDLPVIVAERVT